ncbi:MAG: insulinase family protein [Kiritimatiellia bacterium]|nr:insulinase family protein [Kiritimatiellia bacterium]
MREMSFLMACLLAALSYAQRELTESPLKDSGRLPSARAVDRVRCGGPARSTEVLKEQSESEDEMTVGEQICGFKVTAIENLPEVSGRMVKMVYERNGAELVWLDRADDNKTFGIAFKTPPVDDTGVTHILEHSVLCGSDRYPVKEPFVELLKSSMATYLNASTWPDRTVYPVATRNDRDFQNLVSVYLDAVFHPLCVKNDWAWRQEGWHYEFKDDRLVRNGVVYSEMKGSLASARALGSKALNRAMFPDNAYRFVSGGDPDHIPELTFEKYRAYYEAHYHPSNAKIFLDGRVDLRPILAVLDACLAGFERRAVDFSVPLQRPVSSRRSLQYPATDENGKVFLFDGWGVGTYRDRKRLLALQVLCDYLVGSNESPLKKALLDRKLCTDVSLFPIVLEQAEVELVVENTTSESAETCRRVFRETIDALLKEGLDRRSLSAKLDNAEFQDQEKDFGSYARGLVFMDEALGTWIYGGDPADAFRSAGLFAELREGLEKGCFEQVLREAFVDNPHHAEVTLVPSATLEAEKRVADEAALARTLASMTVEEVAELKRQADDLKRRQATADASEELAKLPRLSLSDIPVQGSYTPMTVTEEAGAKVYRTNVGVDAIIYLNLAFPLDALSDVDLLAVPVLAEMLGYVPTEHHSTLELRNEVDSRLGSLHFSARSTSQGPYLRVSLSSLSSRKDEALRILSEILLQSRFDDAKVVADHIAQARESSEQSFQRRGDLLAMLQAGGSVSRRDEIADMFDGLRQLRWLQSGAACDFAALARRIFTRRVIVSVTDNADAAFVTTLVKGLPDVQERAVQNQDYGASVTSERPRVGLEIASPVGFSGLVGRLPDPAAYSGAYSVAARIASLDHLWNEVRVKGGAYGAYLRVSPTGRVDFGSYRDPDPAGALASFKATGKALETFAQSDESFEKYQVAVIGQMEPYRSPRAEAAYVLDSQLEGLTTERRQQLREEVLRTTSADLLACARGLSAAAEGAAHCVVGGKEILSKCALDRTEPVRRP